MQDNENRTDDVREVHETPDLAEVAEEINRERESVG